MKLLLAVFTLAWLGRATSKQIYICVNGQTKSIKESNWPRWKALAATKGSCEGAQVQGTDFVVFKGAADPKLLQAKLRADPEATVTFYGTKDNKGLPKELNFITYQRREQLYKFDLQDTQQNGPMVKAVSAPPEEFEMTFNYQTKPFTVTVTHKGTTQTNVLPDDFRRLAETKGDTIEDLVGFADEPHLRQRRLELESRSVEILLQTPDGSPYAGADVWLSYEIYDKRDRAFLSATVLAVDALKRGRYAALIPIQTSNKERYGFMCKKMVALVHPFVKKVRRNMGLRTAQERSNSCAQITMGMSSEALDACKATLEAANAACSATLAVNQEAKDNIGRAVCRDSLAEVKNKLGVKWQLLAKIYPLPDEAPIPLPPTQIARLALLGPYTISI